MLIKLNKKAQVGETITWVVATIIIILILTVFIFVSSAVAKGNSLNPFDGSQEAVKKIRLDESADYKIDDLLAEKSFSAYLLTKEGDQTIYQNIQTKGNIDDKTVDVAQKVFKFLYPNPVTFKEQVLGGTEYTQGGEYLFGVWVLGSQTSKNEIIKNDYFSYFDQELIKSGKHWKEVILPVTVVKVAYELNDHQKVILRLSSLGGLLN